MTDSFEERLEHVRRRIESACERSRRVPEDVRMLPVSKKCDPDKIRQAVDCGLTVFGENRVQEAKQKIPRCPGHLEWHMIGHLQRNKVRDAVRLFSMIHSVDSLQLLQSVDTACGQAGITMPVCIEVNVAGESTKLGLSEGEVPAVLAACNELMNVEVVGLMTMPPFAEDPEETRPFFVRLRELRDRLREETQLELLELSMGMSHDFEVAIEEGATWVRLGTVLFGKRKIFVAINSSGEK